MLGGHARGRPRPPNSAPTSQAPAQKCGLSPMVTEPTALTTTMAPTANPDAVTMLAEPRPPLCSTVVAP